MALTSPVIGRLVVDELARLGITDVVLSPGSRNAPMGLAVAARPRDFRLHVRIDERTAAFLALGLGRSLGRPAALLCSSGTATANYHPAVIEADAAGVPLLVLTADRPVELRGTGANQTIVQTALYGGAVRLFEEVVAETPDGITGAVQRAVAAAEASWPGPAHLNVPLPEPLLDPAAAEGGGRTDVAVGRAWTDPGERPDMPVSGSASASTSGVAATSTAAGLDAPDPSRVLGARRTIIVAGEGVAESPEVLDLADRLGIPVLAEPTTGLRLRPPAVRTGHWLAGCDTFLATHQPQVVIILGRPVLSRAITTMVDAAADIVVCDPLDRGWDPGGNATHVVDARFHDWADPVADRDRDYLQSWLRADGIAGTAVDTELDGARSMTEMGTVRDVAAALPDGGQLVVASSLAVRHLNETMRPRPGIRVLGNRGASGIDGFLSTAIGAALGHDGPTVALTGDLSVIHDLTGLVIGPDEPLPTLPIVVINNDGGGIFDLLPYGTRVDPVTFRRLFATPHGVPLEGIAMTLGHGYTAIDVPGELAQVLEDAHATPGITLIEVVTDTPTETARYHRIHAAVDRAIDGSSG